MAEKRAVLHEIYNGFLQSLQNIVGVVHQVS